MQNEHQCNLSVQAQEGQLAQRDRWLDNLVCGFGLAGSPATSQPTKPDRITIELLRSNPPGTQEKTVS
jgi:hypothetical protein